MYFVELGQAVIAVPVPPLPRYRAMAPTMSSDLCSIAVAMHWPRQNNSDFYPAIQMRYLQYPQHTIDTDHSATNCGSPYPQSNDVKPKLPGIFREHAEAPHGIKVQHQYPTRRPVA